MPTTDVLTILDLGTVTRMDIKNVYPDSPFGLTLSYFLDDEGTQPKMLEGTFEMDISTDRDGTKSVLRLTDGEGTSVDENKLIISVVQEQNVLNPREYYYGITNILPDGMRIPVYAGILIVNHFIPAAL